MAEQITNSISHIYIPEARTVNIQGNVIYAPLAETWAAYSAGSNILFS